MNIAVEKWAAAEFLWEKWVIFARDPDRRETEKKGNERKGNGKKGNGKMGNRNAVGKKGNGKLGNLAIVFVHGSFCPVVSRLFCIVCIYLYTLYIHSS